MSPASNNQTMRKLTLSSRCVFNTEFIDSNTKEVLYSTRTPKVWFTTQCVTTLVRHTPSANQPAGSASPRLPEKAPVPEDVSSKSPTSSLPPQYTSENEQEQKKQEGNEVEVTKIQWKCFHETLFEQDFQTKTVSEIMEKTGHRPLRFDRTFKVNGVSYKWDLGLIGFDSPTLKLNDSAETVVAKFHRPCAFTSPKGTLDLRQGSEDILDMIVMTLVWVEWRQRQRMSTMMPTAAIVL